MSKRLQSSNLPTPNLPISQSPISNLQSLISNLQSLPPVIILILYTLLTLILTHPLIFNLTTAVPNDIGDPLLNTWILAWDTHALLADPLNLFNANIFWPLPNTLAFSEHLFSTALLALPIQLISGEPIVAYNLSLLASYPLAAFGMYLLTLRWTRNRQAAFIAGFIFAFAPYRFAAIAHLQLLTFQWLPFALLFLDKIINANQLSIINYQLSIKHYLAFTIFLTLQILTSWYLAVYTALIIAIYLLTILLARRLTLATFFRLAIAFAIIVLMTLPFVLPYLPLIDALREARPLSQALSLAATPTDYAAAAPFNRVFGPLTESLRTRPNFTEENTLFVGVIAPLLVLVAVFSIIGKLVTRHSSFVICHLSFVTRLSSLLILIISIALTFALPYVFVASLIPPASVIRVPPRWIIPTLFALADLAAFGYLVIHSKVSVKPPRGKTRNSKSIFSILIILLLIESFSAPIPLAQVENRAQLNPAYRWLAQQPNDFVLIELPLHSAPDPEFPEVKRLYASTLGWWPLVNGYSGYTPPRQPELAQAIAPFPYEQSIPALQNYQLSIVNYQLSTTNSKLYLLIHPGEAPFDRSQWENVDRWHAERHPALFPLGQFEGDYLYQIIPNTPDRFSNPPLATFGSDQSIQLLSTDVQFSILNSQFSILNYWQPTTLPTTNYTVFIHLRAADGYVRSQADGPPVGNHYPTTAWQPDEIIQDIHPLSEIDLSQVDHIAVGLYNPTTGERLPAFGPNGNRLTDDAVIISLP